MTPLTLKAPITTKADDNFEFFFFSEENKSWHFMWIVCQADDSHEISRLVFSEKKNKKKTNILERRLVQILLGALRVNMSSLQSKLDCVASSQTGFIYRCFHCLLLYRCTIQNTVDSRYLEVQGTLWNTSRYPYLDISDFKN